jgi:hypothetical protein
VALLPVCKYSIIDSCRLVQQGSAHSVDMTRLQNLRTRPFATVAAADILPVFRTHRSKYTFGLTIFKRNGVVTVPWHSKGRGVRQEEQRPSWKLSCVICEEWSRIIRTGKGRGPVAVEYVRSAAGMAVSCLFCSTPSDCINRAMNTGVTSIAVQFRCNVAAWFQQLCNTSNNNIK